MNLVRRLHHAVWQGAILAILVLACGAVLSAPAAQAQEETVVAPAAPLTLEVRKGRVIRLDRPAAAVFVADPDTADVQVHSPSLIYLLGKRAGATSLYAVDENDNVLLRRDVIVEHNLSGLDAVLREIAPGQTPQARSIDGGILLTGNVADPRQAQDVREAASRFLGENEALVNRIGVSAPTQVSLRVRVAEVSREAFKLFGVNWESLFSPGNFTFGLAQGRLVGGASALTSRFVDANGLGNALSGAYSGDNLSINAIIDALEREGVVNVLAEPNLTALSGETASFLAGGEFPIPVGVDDNDIQIEFKPFGVSLAFTPTVLSPERISLKVRPEVSELSDQGAIKLAGITIPALTTRRAETTVELGSGESFAIGGLISNATRSNLEKFPGLGDLPVLGTLFRSSNFRHKESELVIVVTPYLVRPVATAASMATPSDGFTPASDLERILEGRLIRTRLPGKPSSAAGLHLVGPAGFALD
ncbi:MAG: type II and III secretion system protein family protein [Geminicoccaceae bacterium]